MRYHIDFVGLPLRMQRIFALCDGLFKGENGVWPLKYGARRRSDSECDIRVESTFVFDKQK